MATKTGLGNRVCELFLSRMVQKLASTLAGVVLNGKELDRANLISHVQSAHPNYMGFITMDSEQCLTQLEDYFMTTKSKHLYGWMDLIVNGVHPFH